MVKYKLHAGMIEVAVAAFLDYRKNVIVPNISSGFFDNQESDLLVMDGQNRLTEVEIKISVADLKRDFLKPKHTNPSRYISRLIYAVPEEMIPKALELIPNKYGIISVGQYGLNDLKDNHVPRLFCRWVRMVRHNKNAEKLRDTQIRNLFRLGCMRIWTLKSHNNIKNFVIK